MMDDQMQARLACGLAVHSGRRFGFVSRLNDFLGVAMIVVVASVTDGWGELAIVLVAAVGFLLLNAYVSDRSGTRSLYLGWRYGRVALSEEVPCAHFQNHLRAALVADSQLEDTKIPNDPSSLN